MINRDMGISVLILSRNEPFIEPSLESIKSIADEIVVIDSSTGKLAEKIAQVCKIDPKIKYKKVFVDYREQTKVGINETTKKWILKWDADFIAFPEIKELKELSNKLNPSKHYSISFPVQNLELNFFYKNLKKPLHYEPYFFSYSPKLLKKRLIKYYNTISSKLKGVLPNRNAYTPFPLWYKKIYSDKIYALHLNTIKPPMRLVEKQFQAKWALMSQKKKKNIIFEDFVKNNLKKIQMTPEEIYNNFLKTIDVELYEGDYPEILKCWVENKFGIKFEMNEEFNSKLKDYLKEISELSNNYPEYTGLSFSSRIR